MAVLWRQREMVCTLRRLENEEMARLPYAGATLEQQVHTTYSNPRGYAIWESILIKEMLKLQGLNQHDIAAIRTLQKVLNACIEDKFIFFGKNEVFTNIFPPPPGSNPNANSSPRRIQVSENKGDELLNWWYFWFKYVAGELPPLANIAISIITALLTSGAIWFFLLKVIGVHISQ